MLFWTLLRMISVLLFIFYLWYFCQPFQDQEQILGLDVFIAAQPHNQESSLEFFCRTCVYLFFFAFGRHRNWKLQLVVWFCFFFPCFKLSSAPLADIDWCRYNWAFSDILPSWLRHCPNCEVKLIKYSLQHNWKLNPIWIILKWTPIGIWLFLIWNGVLDLLVLYVVF